MIVRDILRFNTCGSVDDGKSTLIGRLLYDSKSLMEDQLEALERSADITGDGQINLANLTDGLRAEREQGITIDVAYRYFATPRRKFIIADTPGHIQYTRNMVTGASTANLSIVLVDARTGVIEQSRRHTYLASLLRIPHLVVAVNKMDLVNWSEERFPTLLGHLETVHIGSDWNLNGLRFPVQWVNRPNKPTDSKLHDFRGFSGQIAGGVVRVGQTIMVLPSGLKGTVKEVWTYDGALQEAFCPQSVTVVLNEEIDVSRGDMLVGMDALPGMSTELQARICWMHPKALQAGRKYLIKHTNHGAQVVISSIENRINVQTFESEPAPRELAINDIGEIKFRASKPLIFDGYASNRLTGSFILIEPAAMRPSRRECFCRRAKW